ncbi:MAG: Ig-like domain-containing protein [Bryobacterales bacterium]|nr:Ig-like domain-containing protein [Bryobacterales bacterium]
MRTVLLFPILAAVLSAQILRIEDTFTDGNSQNQDLASHSFRVFNGRANTVRTDGAGVVRFSEIGTSSEGFWIHFTDSEPLTLRVGDKLAAEATFTLQGFQRTSGQDIRFGLFDSRRTRNTANLTGGMNSGVFSDDPGYGAVLFGSGNGAPFRTYRRTTIPGQANIFLSFDDFTELGGSGVASRATLEEDTAYTLRYAVERLSEDRTSLTVSLSGGGLEDYTYTAVETSANPNAAFDWFGLRITSNAFASGFTFTRFFVAYSPAAPVITTQPSPQSLTVTAGANVQFFAGARGTNLSYQWRRNEFAVEGNESARSATLRLQAVQPADSGSYDVVVSNEGGSVTSNRAVLNVVTGPVGPAPAITTQPRDTTAVLGMAASLTVVASGPGLTYQWFRNGAIVTGATGAALPFPAVSLADAGVYSVAVSNANGSVASNPVRLRVVSAMRLSETLPRDGATGVCTDSGLTMRFSGSVRMGTVGRIRVLRSDGAALFTIDLSDPVQTRNIGGASYRYLPVTVEGDRVHVYSIAGLLPGEMYSVAMDAGALVDASGAPFVGLEEGAWRFRTRTANAPGDAAMLRVSADGEGDFCTVQGAVDHVPAGNAQPVTISVQPGRYREIVYVRGTKPMVTVRGADRFRTVIEYPNNNTLNPTTASRPLFTVDGNDFHLESITLHNTTPKGGSQAEALRTNAQRVRVFDATLRSFQDTLLVNTGTMYMGDSLIEGDVDFLWGGGAAFFRRVEIRSLTSGGILTQVRNPEGRPGFVFMECRLTAAEGVGNTFLSRIAPDQFPFSQAIFLFTAMGAHIQPAGWQFNNAALSLTAANYPNIRFWEFRNTDLEGNPLDRTGRHPLSRELPVEEAAQWAEPSHALGGWSPREGGNASVVLSDLTRIYNGSAQGPSVRTEPPGLRVRLTFDEKAERPVNAGRYAVRAEVDEPAYQGSAIAVFTIEPALAAIALRSMNQRFNGTPRAASAVTRPPGLAVAVRYDGRDDVPSAEGSYVVRAAIADGNYQGEAVGVLTVTPDRATAFPGAEGYGAYALGGRGGDVYHVTSLEDSGPGSLRQGIAGATGPRTIVFDVSGTIRLRSRLNINRSFLTLAGQTAPGDGVTVAGFGVLVTRASHVVIRYMRFRLGDESCPVVQDDALSVDLSSDVILDHVSASWSIDETLSVTNSNRVTVQWSAIAESLNRSCHAEGNHGYGTLLREFNGNFSTLSFHKNLYAHHTSRNPRVGDNVQLEFSHNVIYNWGGDASLSGALEEGRPQVNYVANTLVAGFSTGSSARVRAFRSGSAATGIFSSGNRIDSNVNGVFDPVDTGAAMIQGQYTAAAERFDYPAITAVSYERVLEAAGASKTRDAVDVRIVNGVRTQTGSIIDSQGQVGGYPTLAGGVAPADRDGDGIPDGVEAALGLSPGDASDAARVAANGYTHLENYLNSLVP